MMTVYEFDGKKYQQASKHQKEWGSALIESLHFRGDESILDLGCGDGVLTEKLAVMVPNGKVLGIDASSDMLKTARLHQLLQHLPAAKKVAFREAVIDKMIQQAKQPDDTCFENFRRIQVKAVK